MGYFPVRYDSRLVIYEHKMFIRLATVLHASSIMYQVTSMPHKNSKRVEPKTGKSLSES